ncbi:MAG TPA: glycosyltransferase family 39 protein [Thermoanaerobaculia bacterium]|nr:glycosyltransferase family 39 protein [Thermoanaerobaculia bacterium]
MRPRLALIAVLLLAAALRLWAVRHDLPFSYYGDELHFMRRAMAVGTGDLNPHWFHKPAFFMYLLAFCYGLFFLFGRVAGWFHSTAEFGAHFLFTPTPFLLIGRLLVAACGVATVWVVYRIGRKVFANPWAGIAGALVAAVLAPMIDSSRSIKSDVPCGLWMALSVWAYLETRESPRLRPLTVASLLAGAAMGTHYYGIVLVPAYLALEALRGGSWRTVAGRCALTVLLFGIGFFVTSPYNFLDPTWGRETGTMVAKSLGLGGKPAVRYEPDSGRMLNAGTRETALGAARAFLDLAASREVLGIALLLLTAMGLAATLVRRETRWYGLLVLIPSLFFFLAAITVAAYHAQARHLNALYPLLATLAWPGALAAVRPLRLSEPRARAAALLLVAAAAVPTLIVAVRWNLLINRLDSRLVAYRWLRKSLPRDARVLLDDYGPPLNGDRRSADRMAAILRRLPPGPFTQNQGLRLDLLRRYPPPDGFNLDELGHQWWLPREKSDAELRSDPTDLDMGNPLVSRQPGPLAEYQREGVRYVVTNSLARNQYFTNGGRGTRFPSFVRFYRELDETERVRTFDPRRWGGKGPVIWIYDLTRPAPPGQTPLPELVPPAPPEEGA